MFTPFFIPDAMTCVAPVKPQNTPYTLPPLYLGSRVVCDMNECAIEAPPIRNFELSNDGWPIAALPQIYPRGLPGPWQRVGYVVSSHEDVKDKTMPLFAQKLDYSRNKYNYRVTDTNGVAIDVARNVRWLDEGAKVFVDGRTHPYHVRIYCEFN